MTRWMLDNDDDGHWYLVPVDRHREFGEWWQSEGELPDVPGVLSLGSHPNTVTFEAPQHFGEDVTR